MAPWTLVDLGWLGLLLVDVVAAMVGPVPVSPSTPPAPGPFHESAYCQLVEGSFGAPALYVCPAQPVCLAQESEATPETSRVVECAAGDQVLA
jgi:hypothetical protein